MSQTVHTTSSAGGIYECLVDIRKQIQKIEEKCGDIVSVSQSTIVDGTRYIITAIVVTED